MESFDQSLKYLLQHEPAAFIRFGLGDPSITIVEPVPSVLPSRGRDIDGAYVVQRGGEHDAEGTSSDANKLVVHLEFHRRHQGLEELAVDVAEAQIRLFRRERWPVLSQVWDLYGSTKAPVLDKRTLWYGEDGSRCIYQRVNLRGLSWEELLARAPPALWALAPLTRDGATEAVIEKVCEAIEARTEWTSSERADHLAVVWFIAEAEGVPTRMIQVYLSEGRLMESTLYKSIFEKGEAAGEARGFAQAMIRLLAHHLGGLSPAIQERLRAVSDLDLIQAWYEEVLEANDAATARQVVEKIAATPVPST